MTPFVVQEENVIAAASVHGVYSSSGKVASLSEMTDWQNFINAMLTCYSMRSLESNFEKHLQKHC